VIAKSPETAQKPGTPIPVGLKGKVPSPVVDCLNSLLRCSVEWGWDCGKMVLRNHDDTSQYRAGLPSPPAPASTPDVELVSLSAHGLPGIMVVRAEITIDGGPPPHGPSVRYLDLTTKVEGGWMVLAESDAIGYYLALFR
jgi:hypothetical protein